MIGSARYAHDGTEVVVVDKAAARELVRFINTIARRASGGASAFYTEMATLGVLRVFEHLTEATREHETEPS